MKDACQVLVLAWLACALLVLAMDGRLPAFVAVVAPGSALVVAGSAFARWQRAPSRLDRPAVPERYRVADDLSVPLCVVVAVAEAEAQ